MFHVGVIWVIKREITVRGLTSVVRSKIFHPFGLKFHGGRAFATAFRFEFNGFFGRVYFFASRSLVCTHEEQIYKRFAGTFETLFDRSSEF